MHLVAFTAFARAKGLNNIIQDKAASEQYGLRINGKKTKVMKTDKMEVQLNIQVDGEDLKEVTTFEYLDISGWELYSRNLNAISYQYENAAKPEFSLEAQ